MELAYLAEVRESELVLREVDGDTAAYGGVAPGFRLPREHSWCHAMVAGEAPQLVPDAAALPAGRRAPVRRRDRDPRLRGRARAPRRRHAVRHALLPQPRAAAAAGRARPALPRRARADGGGPARRAPRARTCDRRAEVEAAAGPGAARGAQRARELHRRALRGRARAGARGRRRAGHGRPRTRPSVGQVALLHDIGKVGVPDAILQKPGRLTAPEWDVMREHPAIGAQIVGAIGSLSHLAPAVRAEHERWDGSGYPDGLAGEDVPLASRICLVCDAWHAMTSDRPYRRALTRARRARSCSATPARSSARRRSPRCARARPRRRARRRAGRQRPPREPSCRACARTGRSRPSCGR